MVLIAVQLSVAGIVAPAGVQSELCQVDSAPDDHLAAGPHRRVIVARAAGAPVVLTGVQLSVPDCSARRCSNSRMLPDPPQTIISLPVQTAV